MKYLGAKLPQRYLKYPFFDAMVKMVVDNHLSYCEPFVGGAAMLTHIASLNPTTELIGNDNFAWLIRSHVAIVNNAPLVHAHLLKMGITEEDYYAIRSSHYDTDEQMAAKLIYISQTGFRGLLRFNSKGYCNTPFGWYKNPYIPPIEDLQNFASIHKAAKTKFVHGDYEDVLRGYEDKEPAVFLIDPPYDGSEVGYAQRQFDHERLAQWVQKLADWGHYILLTNYATERILDLYARFPMQYTHELKPFANGNKNARVRTEVMFSNIPSI